MSRLATRFGGQRKAWQWDARDDAAAAIAGRLDKVMQRLDGLNAAVELLIEQRTVKDWYTTAEVAKLLGKAEFTVREWCRLGRVQAEKRPCGRGTSQEWIIAHDELQRVRNEGLLPLPRLVTSAGRVRRA